MKSGYHRAHHLSSPHGLNLSAAVFPSAVWKYVWHLDVPPKIRCFLWKSMHEALPTMARLHQRYSSPTDLCSICQIGSESIFHLFLECPWVVGIWSSGWLHINVVGTMSNSWATWLLSMFNSPNVSKEERKKRMAYIATTCWHTWVARCNFVFNLQPIYPSRILAAISGSFRSFGEARTNASGPAAPTARGMGVGGGWVPPGPGYVKINVDASWCASEGLGYTAVVARDEEGRFLAAGRFKDFAPNVAVMEAKAILHRCKLGVSRGWELIVVESDST